MKKITVAIALLVATAILWRCTPQTNGETGEEENYFDGNILEGWFTKHPEYWSVRDSAIVAKATAEVPKNEFL